MDIQLLDKSRGEAIVLLLGHYPFVTTLPDISEYEFNLPENNDFTLTPRKKIKREVFDISKFIINRNVVVEAPKKRKTTKRYSNTDIDDLIVSIDRQIKKIEEENRNKELMGGES